jgi:hypothetical protein
VRSHTAVSIKQFLAKQAIPQLHHPPYPPDISPPDLCLAPKIKSLMKGRRFEDIEDIKRNVADK